MFPTENIGFGVLVWQCQVGVEVVFGGLGARLLGESILRYRAKAHGVGSPIR